MRIETIAVVAWALIACKTPGPSGSEASIRGQEVDRGCKIQLSVEREQSGGFWFLHANALNQTGAPIHLELEARCPGGLADFQGLGDGYDYYGACAMGACADREAPVLELPPGVSLRVATAVVAPKGNGCQPALTEVSYSVRFALPLKAAVQGLCSEPLAMEHQLE
jgi:hypothetical protein